jgi:hypothetical protein
VVPGGTVPDVTNLFGFDELAAMISQAGDGAHDLSVADVDGAGAVTDHPYRRLVDHARVLYRRDDLSAALPLGQVEPMALPFQQYRLALTPELLATFRRGTEDLLPDPVGVLRDEGGYAAGDDLTTAGLFPLADPGGLWWVPSGRTFYAPGATNGGADPAPGDELARARAHFFVPCLIRDAFGNPTTIRYDGDDLLPLETQDALGNRVSVGERAPDGTVANGNDYRVLRPALITDPNGNRSAVAFDALGLVAGSAVMGKPAQELGDSLAGFAADPTPQDIDAFFADPTGLAAAALLGDAGSRVVYDLDRFRRGGDTVAPVYAASLIRETHATDLPPDQATRFLVNFSYSDGFGREIQKKNRAEPGPVVDGGAAVSPRWVGSGWTIFDNKGQPVRRYEPFFDDTHDFRFGNQVGVASTLCYDPVGRVVAVVHPDRTWEKVVIDPWRRESWDGNDTVLIADPAQDLDVGALIGRLPTTGYLPTWYAARIGGALGDDQRDAAAKAAAHAATPTVTHTDPLGRTFQNVVANGPAVTDLFHTLTALDVLGRLTSVTDALDRTASTYGRDVLGRVLLWGSVDAGQRWTLPDATGGPMLAWDQRDHRIRQRYDALRRPTDVLVVTGPGHGPERVAERVGYGESEPGAADANLLGRVARQFDAAGTVSHDRYDFKGNLRQATRRFAGDYRDDPDWSGTPALDAEEFVTGTRYDALNRPVALTTPGCSPGSPWPVPEEAARSRSWPPSTTTPWVGGCASSTATARCAATRTTPRRSGSPGSPPPAPKARCCRTSATRTTRRATSRGWPTARSRPCTSTGRWSPGPPTTPTTPHTGWSAPLAGSTPARPTRPPPRMTTGRG